MKLASSPQGNLLAVNGYAERVQHRLNRIGDRRRSVFVPSKQQQIVNMPSSPLNVCLFVSPTTLISSLFSGYHRQRQRNLEHTLKKNRSLS